MSQLPDPAREGVELDPLGVEDAGLVERSRLECAGLIGLLRRCRASSPRSGGENLFCATAFSLAPPPPSSPREGRFLVPVATMAEEQPQVELFVKVRTPSPS